LNGERATYQVKGQKQLTGRVLNRIAIYYPVFTGKNWNNVIFAGQLIGYEYN